MEQELGLDFMKFLRQAEAESEVHDDNDTNDDGRVAAQNNCSAFSRMVKHQVINVHIERCLRESLRTRINVSVLQTFAKSVQNSTGGIQFFRIHC